MKTPKKHAKKQLEKFSTIFTQLGLVLTLFVVFLVLEHETVKDTAVVEPTNVQDYEKIYTFDTPFIIRSRVKEIVKPKKKRVIKEIFKPEVVDNNTENTTVIDLPVDEAPIDLNQIPELKETETIEDSDDPISIKNVQNTPVFKGCEGLSEEENIKCFERKIQQHIQRNFNSELAQDVELNSGKYKILTQFVIDKLGNVTDIQIRAPHTKLKKETNRVVNKIPKFTPGKQNNKEVKVKYTLPITFRVE
ncbi:energy transducer TonB [Tenacibaculum sp. XPcli2-G]|uniref:energy transducer TonB n=1 Tax=Tenacibaculum sp. XPcli2-G TaxID=2954503 RepID=UPI002097374F|nr:energy transducer TonB [Tenacibaculum sp. XPcli2-G]MCO7184393.1 energy transducer TonB [Tenacibaculum sp. XPcli2-G]